MDVNGNTIIHKCIYHTNTIDLDLLKQLLKLGVDPAKCNENNCTALMMPGIENVSDEVFNTILQCIADKDNQEAAEEMARRNINTARKRDGSTALDICILHHRSPLKRCALVRTCALVLHPIHTRLSI